MYLVIAGCKLLSNRVINISKGSQEARLKALYLCNLPFRMEGLAKGDWDNDL